MDEKKLPCPEAIRKFQQEEAKHRLRRYEPRSKDPRAEYFRELSEEKQKED